MNSRKIIHVDMDAFYASVELLDNPALRGQPVVVGGSPQSRGVVATASYEARKYGIHSAMPCARVPKLCPHAVFVQPRFDRYKEISQQVRAVFHRYTDLIEPLSLDEAWLDVTENHVKEPSATRIAQRIRAEVKDETGLTCSAGVSFNKFLAKVASDENKPDGLCVVTPQNAPDFIAGMKLKKIPGVGPKFQEKLKKEGFEYGRDLLHFEEEDLFMRYGKMGRYLYRMLRAEDNRPVKTHCIRKSLGAERTFSEDYMLGGELLKRLDKLVDKVIERSQGKSIAAKTLTLKVKFHDFEQITRSESFPRPVTDFAAIRRWAKEMLETVCIEEFPERPIRLVGVSLSNFADGGEEGPVQLSLWE